MSHAVPLFEPCLSQAEAADIPDLMRRFGPLRTYVEAPASEGIGKGLVRRHDAVLNYYRQQQAAGRSEPLPVTVARTNLFRGIFVERSIRRAPGAEALSGHPGFTEAAGRLSGGGDVSPTMLYANILVPGQELAVHTDTPEFRGLDKQDVPEWLLVVMAASGLFERFRVRIAATVSFFSACAGGDFLVWAEGPESAPARVPPRPNTAVAVDADALFHGVARVGGDDAPPPPVAPNSSMTWDGEAWRLQRGDELDRSYAWDEVRLSFQWKARVDVPGRVAEDTIDEATAVARLEQDLRDRGAISGDPPTGPRLGLTLIDTYLRFPGSAARR